MTLSIKCLKVPKNVNKISKKAIKAKNMNEMRMDESKTCVETNNSLCSYFLEFKSDDLF